MNDRLPRVLFVELVVVDRFHCGVAVPYLQGAVQAAGGQARTVVFGLRAAEAFSGQTGQVDIGGASLERLAQEAARLGATHVLISHAASAKALRAIAARTGAVASSLAARPVEVIDGAVGAQPLAEWLGVAGAFPANPFLAEAADFSSVPGNALAAGHRPLPHLVCGAECRHLRPASANPGFAGLTLSAEHDQGCSFCLVVDREPFGRDPFVLLERHLSRALETVSWVGRRPRYRVIGDEVFERLGEVVDVVARLRLPASDFLFSCRVDRALAAAHAIDEALSRLAGTGHRIQLGLVGLESFRQAELDRFNKGITVAQSLRFLELLGSLERRHREVFDFREHGGLSTILFTPWTSLEDVELNLRLIDLLGIDELCGKALGSRLRLYRGLPLCTLAEQDSLCVEGYDDPALDTARRNFYPEEVPWRFADPRVELFCPLSLRVPREDAFSGDELHQQVQQARQASAHSTTSDVGLAIRLLEAVQEHGAAVAPEKILGSLRRAEVPVAPARRGERDLWVWPAEVLAFEGGWRRVGLREGLDRAELGLLEVALRRALGQDLVVDAVPCAAAQGRLDVFYGRAREQVERAKAAATVIRDSKIPTEVSEATVEIGALLGYPSCCAHAFAAASPFERSSNEWLHARRRSETPGQVDPLLNPFGELWPGYVPCSAACPETTERLAALRAFLDRPAGGPELQDARARARLPVLYLLDSPGSFVFLDPSAMAEGEILYTASVSRGGDPRLAPLRRGNRLLFDEGTISIFRRDERLHTFVLDAALWWHRQAFHAEFWRLCASLAASASSSCAAPQTEAPRSRAEAALFRVAEAILSRTGFALESVEPGSDGIACVLSRGHERLKLELAEPSSAGPAYLRGAHYAVRYDSRTPVDSEDKERAAAMVLSALDKAKEQRGIR